MNKILKELTDAAGGRACDWEEIDGPDSGVGVDHWFRNNKTNEEAYVNDDQGFISVSTEGIN